MTSDQKQMDPNYLIDVLTKNKLSNMDFNPAYCGAKCIKHFKEIFRKHNVNQSSNLPHQKKVDVENDFCEHLIKARPTFKQG